MFPDTQRVGEGIGVVMASSGGDEVVGVVAFARGGEIVEGFWGGMGAARKGLILLELSRN